MNDFRWPRALLHGAAFLGLAFLIGITFAIVRAGIARQAGGIAVNIGLPAFLVGLVWSYGHQTGRENFKVVATILLVFLFVLELVILAKAGRRKGLPQLTDEERVHPKITQTAGGTVVCQEPLGISFQPLDTKLTPAPDLEAKLENSPDRLATQRWVYREAGGGAVVLSGSKGFDTEQGLHDFANGFLRAATAQRMAPHQRIQWNGDHGTIDVGTRFLEMHCVSSSEGTLGCVETISRDPARLETLRQSLRVGECG